MQCCILVNLKQSFETGELKLGVKLKKKSKPDKLINQSENQY